MSAQAKAQSAAPSQDVGPNEDLQAHQDLHHLVEAEKIKKDRKRHAAAMKKHAEMTAALQNIAAQQGAQGAQGGQPGIPQQPPQMQMQPVQAAQPTANIGAY